MDIIGVNIAETGDAYLNVTLFLDFEVNSPEFCDKLVSINDSEWGASGSGQLAPRTTLPA
jgi:hypothetical protein